MNQFLRMCRNGGQVQRNHNWRTLRTQTVGDHTFNVMSIILAVAGETASRELLVAALYHDLPEQVTGDMPAPVKWKHGSLGNIMHKLDDEFAIKWGLICHLEDDERLLLKFADQLEFMCFTLEEMRLGNSYAEPRFNIMNKTIGLFLVENRECIFYSNMRNLFDSTVQEAGTTDQETYMGEYL